MIIMKIEFIDDKIILYLKEFFFKEKDNNKIIDEMKEIFIKLIKYHSIKMQGYYDVEVFENKKYGTILEIIPEDKLLFHPDLIDIKVKFYKNTCIYLRSRDYFAFKNYKNIYYDKDYYYIDINEVDNILPVIEFVDILYKEKENYLRKKNFLK